MENADGGGERVLPPISLHNFTSLVFPKILTSGRALDSRTSRNLKDIYPFSILVVSPGSLDATQDYDFLFQHVGVMLWDPESKPHSPVPHWVDIRLSHRPDDSELELACSHMLRLLELKEQCMILHNTNAITEARNRQLNQIGVALMTEKNLDTLLDLILDKAMELTSSDAGCLYLVEAAPEKSEVPGKYWSNKQIRFKLTRNESVRFNFLEMVLNPSKSSIVGFSLMEGKPLNIPDVYHIDVASEFRHNAGFDKTSGYRTRSMLTLPMMDHQNQVVGGIQLINKCRSPRSGPITSLESADRQVMPYRQDDVNLCLSLASQASVALLNAQYELDIKNLFEGFINASISAIESRDPTTSGHSHRVADYSVRMADCVGRQRVGKYKEVRLTDPQLRELRYAALLHDFGKIGVREHILTKSSKLFPHELEHIRHRAEFIKRTVHWETAQAKLDILTGLENSNPEREFRRLEEQERLALRNVDAFHEAVRKANEPRSLDPFALEFLESLGKKTYRDTEGGEKCYLHPEELSRLTIPRGTLTIAEREEINTHVSHTYKFLSQIPWTRDLLQVPNIAFAHHEKLDGSGYPRRLKLAEIPIGSQIMAICDIFDALAAADRPYKKALPTERALDILADEVKSGKIDQELFQIFLDGQVYLAPRL